MSVKDYKIEKNGTRFRAESTEQTNDYLVVEINHGQSDFDGEPGADLCICIDSERWHYLSEKHAQELSDWLRDRLQEPRRR